MKKLLLAVIALVGLSFAYSSCGSSNGRTDNADTMRAVEQEQNTIIGQWSNNNAEAPVELSLDESGEATLTGIEGFAPKGWSVNEANDTITFIADVTANGTTTPDQEVAYGMKFQGDSLTLTAADGKNTVLFRKKAEAEQQPAATQQQ
ncbi:MAG: hypothetical protein II592_02550 [Muribaculaceae bacterium]|nr:hypothetical protein [Muribaculaceae bacterium]MBQ4138407.1 hypothetical protein [Muribaculaceae bacterium]